MGILGFLGSVFKPAADLVDNLHTSEEEKMELRKQMMQIEFDIQARALEYESKLTEAQASIVKAEATGHSWIQQNWRPITMLTFLVLVLCDSFGLLKTPLAEGAWDLLKIGLGGYVVGRSAEKIIPTLVNRKDGAVG